LIELIIITLNFFSLNNIDINEKHLLFLKALSIYKLYFTILRLELKHELIYLGYFLSNNLDFLFGVIIFISIILVLFAGINIFIKK
jgi:hypothetical protein